MINMALTLEEATQIKDQRAKALKRALAAEGILLAADYLERLGQECGGGDGSKVNPVTGQRWGEEYFVHADMLRAYAEKA